MRLVSVAVATLLLCSDAHAVKLRKKPPLKPLPAPLLASDIAQAQDASSASASNSSSTATAPVTASAPRPSTRVPAAKNPYPSGNLICLYGSEYHAVSKTTRCLAPEQLSPPRWVRVNSQPLAEQLGLLASAPGLRMPANASAAAATPTTASAPAEEALEGGGSERVKIARVSFENGHASGVQRGLRSKRDEIATCMTDHGGLKVASARLKLLFFVGANQKPTGMVVASAKNIPSPIVRCIRGVVEKTQMGRPSSEAVGVTAVIELKNDGGKN